MEGAVQTIPQGPFASQEAIKMIGTNGGGFTNANSAHPFENPTPLANFFQMLFIFIIPAGLTYTFGKMVKDTRQGWAHFRGHAGAVSVRRLRHLSGRAGGQSEYGQIGRRPQAATWRARKSASASPTPALFTVITTDASCGAVNNQHDSLTPLGGLVPHGQHRTGRSHLRRRGLGAVRHVDVRRASVFIAGLMVGRTPEYLGKKIEQKEVKMMMLSVLVLAISILGFSGAGGESSLRGQQTAWAIMGRMAFPRFCTPTRARTGNNGSAFGGFNANTPYLNTTHGARHALRPLPDDDPSARRGRQPGAEETDAGLGGDLSHPRAAVCLACSSR